MDVLEFLIVESGADLVDEAQAAVALILPQQQRSEMGSASGRIGITADYEALCQRAFDFQPVIAAPSAIGRGPQLRHHPFQSCHCDGLKKVPAAANDMFAIAQRPLALDQPLQEILALLKRQAAQIELVEGRQIKHEMADRHRQAHPCDVARVLKMHPALQKLKVRTALVVQRHDFPINHEALVG